MPKIIKDLDHKIFKVAFELFGQYGYKSVDMKKISKEVGIAVGTLYNYYPNKKELFLNVFRKSWEDTFSKLQDIIDNEDTVKKKIISFITILYDEIENRKGLGDELFKEKIVEDEKRNFIRGKLTSKLKKLLEQLFMSKNIELEKYILDRLVETLLITTVTMLNVHPHEKKENIQYISYLIETTTVK